MLAYNFFGRSRNWHPRQVDELDLDEVEWLPLLEEACLQASDVIRKEEQAQNGR
jgi:hypothetical protein